MNKMIAAAIQMVSGASVADNLKEAGRLLKEAADKGAALAVLPENFAFMGAHDYDKLEHKEKDGAGPIQDFLARAAERYGIWIVAGTIPLEAASPHKVRAACLVYGPEGKRVARYDKIHLFDVSVPGTQETYKESSTIEAGEESQVIATPFGRLGVAVCYDIRFPELFRQMAQRGLDILAVPAAFTVQTGAAHWELLVRARSVENLCYTVGAAQDGSHPGGRETYGHSLIVDPWGTVLAGLDKGAGVVCAEIERARIEQIRLAFPALRHRRLPVGT